MWLTGFDAPCVHTMYVDKPMKGHNLMQAIARVNRVFKDKQGGLVVDYIGIGNELKAAMKEYTASKGRGKPTVDAREALSVMLEKLDVLQSMLHGCDYSGFKPGATNAGKAGQPCAGPAGKNGRQARRQEALCRHALAMSQAFSLCCTLDEAKAVRDEVAFMQAVKVILTKRDITARSKPTSSATRPSAKSSARRWSASRWWTSFDAVGLDKPNIGLLDDEFLAQVKNLPEKNLAVELLERLLEGEIKSKFATNVVQQKKFSSCWATSSPATRTAALKPRR
jgi:type I restriction enzyme R subunit